MKDEKILYALVLKGSCETVMIEEGLWYGQPTKSTKPQFLTREELNRMLGNPYFYNNILQGRCDIREVVVTFGKNINIIQKAPPPYEVKFELPK